MSLSYSKRASVVRSTSTGKYENLCILYYFCLLSAVLGTADTVRGTKSSWNVCGFFLIQCNHQTLFSSTTHIEPIYFSKNGLLLLLLKYRTKINSCRNNKTVICSAACVSNLFDSEKLVLSLTCLFAQCRLSCKIYQILGKSRPFLCLSLISMLYS